jgi:hypothetical protein
MKTPFNSAYSKGRVNLRSKTHIVAATSEIDECPSSVETVAGACHSFYNIQLETNDDAILLETKKEPQTAKKRFLK